MPPGDTLGHREIVPFPRPPFLEALPPRRPCQPSPILRRVSRPRCPTLCLAAGHSGGAAAPRWGRSHRRGRGAAAGGGVQRRGRGENGVWISYTSGQNFSAVNGFTTKASTPSRHASFTFSSASIPDVTITGTPSYPGSALIRSTSSSPPLPGRRISTLEGRIYPRFGYAARRLGSRTHTLLCYKSAGAQKNH
jgi:hypothetical protein